MTKGSRGLPVSAALAALLALSSAAFAQSTTSNMNGLKLSGDKPIQIESDELEVRQQENSAFFKGNVRVVQGTTTMQSQSMVVKYKNKQGEGQGNAQAGAGQSGSGQGLTGGDAKIDTIDVLKDVVLNTETQKATADKGHFDMNSQVFILEGDKVVLSEGKNVFVGCRLTVKMTTGEAKLDSCGGRVQIQLDPKSQQKQ
ncbi:LptA/OstA family protein [Allorhizobium undicola]|uniref:LptA/OstA family protein n=1 Tax=Allorhizobium undicola TaxID=78527 RepID=UPI000483A279|nr:LptA/OstA family protein [Allorhizobium undicola]